MCCTQNEHRAHPGATGHQAQCCCGGSTEYRSKKMQLGALEDELARRKNQVADLEAYISELKAE